MTTDNNYRHLADILFPDRVTVDENGIVQIVDAINAEERDFEPTAEHFNAVFAWMYANHYNELLDTIADAVCNAATGADAIGRIAELAMQHAREIARTKYVGENKLVEREKILLTLNDTDRPAGYGYSSVIRPTGETDAPPKVL
jgi:hypothetical protein